MRTKILLAVFLLFSILSSAQRARPSNRPPTYKPPTYKPPSTKPGGFGKDYSSILKDYPPGTSTRIVEFFSKSDRVSVVKHIAKWQVLESIFTPEYLEAHKKYETEYEVAYENGKFDVLHCGEIITKDFSITESNNSITVKANSTLKNKRIELVFDELIWKKGKKINAENIALKLLAKNGEIYEVERVTIENGEIRYMASIKEGIWIEPNKSDVTNVNRNLEREFDKELVRVISIVRDFKTNKVLKEEVGSKSMICKSKKDLIDKITSQEEGSTIFIVGHHEKGRFVTHNEKGEVLFELTSSEINQIIKEKNINIFPMGCKTAFSDFNEGANIDLNSLKLIQSLAKSLSSSNTFGELLQSITKSEPSLRFLVENNSFGAVKVEVIKETSWETRSKGNSQRDSTEIGKKRFVSTKPINTTKIGSGYIFTVPNTGKTYSSNDNLGFDSLATADNSISNTVEASNDQTLVSSQRNTNFDIDSPKLLVGSLILSSMILLNLPSIFDFFIGRSPKWSESVSVLGTILFWVCLLLIFFVL